MADKARDLVARFITDTDRFTTATVERGLEAVEDASDDAGRKLDALGKDADGAGTKLDGLGSDASGAGGKVDGLARDVDGVGAKLDALGTDAKGAGTDLGTMATDAKDAGTKVETLADSAEQTGRRVGDAFDKIKQSSGVGLKQVGTDAREAAEEVEGRFGESADEVKQEGIAMAASFDGSMTSVADSAQALASVIASSLGPVGAGVGIAAALGFGAWRAATEKQTQAVADLFSRLQALEEGTSSNADATKEWLDGLEDQGKELKTLQKDADTLGVSIADLAGAYAGNVDALQRVTEATDRYREAEIARGNAQDDGSFLLFERIGQTLGLSEATADLSDTYNDATERQALYNAALGDTSAAATAAKEAQDAYNAALEGFVDPMSVYTEALQTAAQETADKTGDSGDSWEDYADRTDVALSTVITGLEKQVKAQEEWSANMITVAGRASSETLEYLSSLGPEGAPLVAKLATASDEEMAKFEDLMKRRAAAGVDGAAAELDKGGQVARDAARMLGEAMGQEVADGLASKQLDIEAAAAKIRDAVAQKYRDKIQLMVEAKLDANSISLVRQEAAMAARYRG